MVRTRSQKLQLLKRSLRRRGSSSMQLVMASAIAIPIAGGILFLGFQICRYVFSTMSGLLSMPFV